MTELQPFAFPDTGEQVRTVMVDGNPWFVAGDVAAILGFREAYDLTRGLDDDEKGPQIVRTPGGSQAVTVISEAGLYSAILRSRVPAARTFKRWVTHDLLPTIRRTGRYDVAQEQGLGDELAELELANERLSKAIAIAKDERGRREIAERKAAEGASFRSAIEAGDGLSIRAFHKKYFSDVPERRFFDHLYAKGYLIDQRGKGAPRADGTRGNGAEHRHPGHKGKHFFYLHGNGVHGGKRRESTRVRPGQIELELKDRLASDGLAANSNATGQLALMEGGVA